MNIEHIEKMYKELAEPWLSLFPKNLQGMAANFILKEIRFGDRESACDCSSCIENIADTLKEKVTRWRFYSLHSPSGEAIKKNIESSLFVGCIEYYLAYEGLSYDEKQQLKRKKSLEFIQKKMQSESATERQISYLKSLGYKEDTDMLSKLEASELIDAFLKP